MGGTVRRPGKTGEKGRGRGIVTRVETPGPNKVVALLKLLVFTLLVPCTFALWLPRYLYPSVYRSDVHWDVLAVTGVLLMAFGLAGYLWTSLDFAFRGHGTPAPIDPPKILVVRGLYRYVRNPMYISVALVLGGECLLFRSWVLARYLAWCFAIVFLVVLFYEEPVLRGKFGPVYKQYCRDVPRWLPRLRRPHR